MRRLVMIPMFLIVVYMFVSDLRAIIKYHGKQPIIQAKEQEIKREDKIDIEIISRKIANKNKAEGEIVR